MNNGLNNEQNNNQTNQQNNQFININPPAQEQQQYQQPMPQYQNQVNEEPTNNKLNKNALWSAVFSTISVFIFWWLAIAGVGLGFNALKEIKAGKGTGKFLALLGIIIGIISLVLYYYVQRLNRG